MECYTEDGGITSNTLEVLQNWELDFSKLYNYSDNDFDTEFYNEALKQKQIIEDNIMNPAYIPNRLLNKDITRDEVAWAILHAKDGEAPGIDCIYNEVLKNRETITVLLKLFQLCFKTGKVPNLWKKALIHPIPKDTKLDPRIPTNYRGISLLSVVAKCYSCFLNNRIQSFLK